jgi:hypothetical protein
MILQKLPWAQIAASVIGFSALGFSQGQAAVVVYTDRATWKASWGGGTGDIQDDFSSGTFVRTGYTITTGAPAALGAFPATGGIFDVDGTPHLVSFVTSTSGHQVTFTFSSAIRTFGYDVNPRSTPEASSSLGATINFAVNGTAAGSYNLPATDVTEFRGFFSDTPFTTFRMTTAASNGHHGIDNLEGFTTVPEPAETAAVGAVALVAFGLIRRHSRSKV